MERGWEEVWKEREEVWGRGECDPLADGLIAGDSCVDALPQELLRIKERLE